jgi:hypothetical protein
LLTTDEHEHGFTLRGSWPEATTFLKQVDILLESCRLKSQAQSSLAGLALKR